MLKGIDHAQKKTENSDRYRCALKIKMISKIIINLLNTIRMQQEPIDIQVQARTMGSKTVQ